MRDEGTPASNHPGSTIASALLARLPELATALADGIQEHVEVYRPDGPVPPADLYESCRDNLEFMLAQLGHENSVDLDAPRRTGRRRAEQGVPLAMVQKAFRHSCAAMWEMIVAQAATSSSVTDADLVSMASEVWTIHDTFTTAMMSSFSETMAELILQRDQERSALVEAVLRGGTGDNKTIIDAADLLALPYSGTFAVVVADAPGLAQHALPNIETTLRAHTIGSAWRLSPDLHIGIVSLRDAHGMPELIKVLSELAIDRVGVSPAYGHLDQTPRAMHLARNALESAQPGTATVTLFDDAPLPMLVVSAPSTAAAISKQILGPLLELPEADRELLLTTMATYFAVDGSASLASEQLYCHPNTVRYRLRKIEQLCGRSFDRPLDSAELYVALDAVRRVPM